MARLILGWLFILQALAQSSAGVWGSGQHSIWIVTGFWLLAVLGYLGAGLGLLGVERLRRSWPDVTIVATAASIVLVAGFGPPAGPLLGIADVVLLLASFVLKARIDDDFAAMGARRDQSLRHPRWASLGRGIRVVTVGYLALVISLRPVILQWGSTAEERAAALPGDEMLPLGATYRADQAITIRARRSAIWPWMMQIGQDRGGFYSYDWFERALGYGLHNADRIHPEWQNRRVGDTVFAARRGSGGGRVESLGWRIAALEPERVLGLENWATFVLWPIDSSETRLIVRTRGSGRALGIASFWSAPLGVFVLEPAHLIMQRGMLRGLRDRAERSEVRVGSVR